MILLVSVLHPLQISVASDELSDGDVSKIEIAKLIFIQATRIYNIYTPTCFIRSMLTWNEPNAFFVPSNISLWFGTRNFAT